EAAKLHKPREQAGPTSSFDDLFDLTPEDRPAPVDTDPNAWTSRKFPAEPQKDLVGFIAEHSRHLEPWHRDVIGIVREEMLYFVPQMQTKIVNEGWASCWHARIMRELDLSDKDYTEFATLNAGVVAPSTQS